MHCALFSCVSILTRTEVRVLQAWQSRAIAGILVSILTRTEVRVLPHPSCAPWCHIVFQSSPAPRYGCCIRRSASNLKHAGFNPHPHRGTGAALHRRGTEALSQVSILTRTEVRVLLCQCQQCQRREDVSILTRTEVRVLPMRLQGLALVRQFQSSPAPRYGCCSMPKLIRPENSRFQSSPAPRYGCCPPHLYPPSSSLSVSILTRTEVRVLHSDNLSKSNDSWFQSSPAPRYGCCQHHRRS